jgi:hypothetical protein
VFPETSNGFQRNARISVAVDVWLGTEWVYVGSRLGGLALLMTTCHGEEKVPEGFRSRCTEVHLIARQKHFLRSCLLAGDLASSIRKRVRFPHREVAPDDVLWNDVFLFNYSPPVCLCLII